MPLNWNEIKSGAAAFSKEWDNNKREEADIDYFPGVLDELNKSITLDWRSD